MAIQFEVQSANWVLVSPAALPGLVLTQPVIDAAGGRPSQVVQVSDVAVATFPGLQVACMQIVPEQYTYTVTETGRDAPTDRLSRVARALFEQVTPMAAPIALGCNLVLFGRVSEGNAADVLLRLLNPAITEHLAENDRQVSGAGTKIVYGYGRWRVTLSFEQHAVEGHIVVAAINCHMATPPSQDIVGLIEEQNDLFGLTTELLPGLLGDGVGAAVG